MEFAPEMDGSPKEKIHISAMPLAFHTIADNMSISDAQLRQILKTYDKTTVWYARDIKGERRAAEGLVYPMFSEARHVLSQEPDTEGEYYVSSDYGIQNPNVFLTSTSTRSCLLTGTWPMSP